MKIAIMTCGMLPIPAVQGGAVENLIDFYLEYNNTHKLHDITIYSPWDAKVEQHPALSSDVNHYVFIDVTSLKARITRRIRSFFHSNEYYNYFIEYYFEKVYTDFKKHDFDLIILENSVGFTYKLSKRGYQNLILHLHNELLHSESLYHDIIFNSLKKILTVSDYIKNRVSSIQSCSKIQTVHNGIDLKSFTPKEISSINRKTIGFLEDDFIMIYSGRINKEKGVSELIDTMLLLKDIPNIKLMIIGGSFFGNTNHDDAFIISLKEKTKTIKDKIIFTGFIPYEDMPNYLQLADIAVIPSIWNDPFPTTELEAQAMGLPIITTRRGGIPEEVSEDNAILLEIDEHFVSNLASAIIDLYKHPEKREQMSEVSLKRAKLFDKKIFAANFFAAIENI
jgi:glycosyltransferase involved in cell wall biosynthesis